MKITRTRRNLLAVLILFLSFAFITPSAEAGSFRGAIRGIKKALTSMSKSLMGLFVDDKAIVRTSPVVMHASMAEVIMLNDRRANGEVSLDQSASLITIGIKNKKKK